MTADEMEDWWCNFEPESPLEDSTIQKINELLVLPGHREHQSMAMFLQHAANPGTVPYVRKVLESNFDYLEYTASGSGAIAKWLSWLLFSIGTPEAIDLIKEYTQSPDPDIRREMIYRLSKVQ